MKSNLITIALILVTPLVGMASVEDDATSLSYISYLERYATVFPAGGPETLEAAINMPLVAGDRLDTAREARMEVVLADGTMLWLDEYTTVSLDSVALSRDTRGDRTVLFLADGAMMLELPQGVQQRYRTRIDGANETVHLQGPGIFRIEVLRTGGLWVEVWEGLAEAATSMGDLVLKASSASEINDGRVSSVDTNPTDRDDFARWVQARRNVSQGPSAQYVDQRYARQASQLDAYGTWVYLDDVDTWAWQPTVVVDWQPYTSGRWYWTSVGWCWQAYEPWGWLPYHYGSWWNSPAYGWVWCWGSVWSPAWVHWSYGGGYIGWCPVGWYSSWWWDCGWGWGGYYPPYGPGYGPGYPSYPHPLPGQPRRDAVVRPGSPRGGNPGGGQPGIRSARPRAASDLVLDMEGRARMSALDSRAWSVVSERDFASPNVGRIVRAGGDALRTQASRAEMAVITSKPLVTASPRQVKPASELARVFEARGQQSSADLTPVIARAGGLSRDEAQALVKPREAASFAASSARSSSVEVSPASSDRVPGRVAGAVRSEEPSYDASVGGSGRAAGGNFFRSNLYPSGGASSTGSGSGGRMTGSPGSTRSAPATRSSSPSSGRTAAPSSVGTSTTRGSVRSSGARSTPTLGSRSPSAGSGSSSSRTAPLSLSGRSLSGGSARTPVTSSSVRTPVTRSSPSSSRSSGKSRAPVTGSNRAVPSNRTPVVVPRTSSSRGSSSSSRSPVVVPRSGSSSSSRSNRSPVVIPRTSSGSRSAPSPRASSSSRSYGSSSRSYSSSRSSGSYRSSPSSRSSSSSRSGGGSVSRSSSSSRSSGMRSSGGSMRSSGGRSSGARRR